MCLQGWEDQARGSHLSCLWFSPVVSMGCKKELKPDVMSVDSMCELLGTTEMRGGFHQEDAVLPISWALCTGGTRTLHAGQASRLWLPIEAGMGASQDSSVRPCAMGSGFSCQLGGNLDVRAGRGCFDPACLCSPMDETKVAG